MPRAQKHLPALDGIRGIAILIVLIGHSAPQIADSSPLQHFFRGVLHNGWVGVDLFFVLSGFLITGILLHTRRATNYFRTFYMRRFLRIFPIYYLTLTVVFLTLPHSRIFASWIPETLRHQAAYFLYLQNLPAFWRFQPGQADLLRPYWSLAVEEQFYLVWPMLILLLSERAILIFCGSVVALAIPFRIAAVLHWGAFPGFLYLTSSRFDGLFVGAAVAVITQHRRIPLRILALAASVAVAAWAVIFSLHPAAFWDESTDALVAVIGVPALAILFGSFVAFSLHQIRPFHRILCSASLRSLGRYSYGMYVYHFLVFSIAGVYLRRYLHWKMEPFQSVPAALVYIAATILLVYVIAKFSFDLFEAPVLKLKRRFEPDDVARTPVTQTDPSPVV